ncbi:alpha-L-rhamnosidase-like protein [Neolewinella xylanilytica]|uniref:Alpha-L-rhamnosidase-like protein n=1 Tax=Neolewinella xylanilytica TaxID=1514080 RepID=A0A2S6I3Y6_9BACT|nr:glycosyl hydrolase [Neolewinella xylanilytica]PPK85894.1 alpha-L-rhamnosidase-like protein [Neolewinella xylanilytica]
MTDSTADTWYSFVRKAATVLLLTCAGWGSCLTAQSDLPDWPEVTAETRPWTRWWWHGSAVTEAGITSELETLAAAGFGGVELTPIFGVIGEENQFVDYLSKDWVDLLVHTLTEADRLGMLVDMATGTGWPFGGPWVTEADGAKYLAHRTYALSEGASLPDKIFYEQEAIERRASSPVLTAYRLAEERGQAYADISGEAVRAAMQAEDTELAPDFMETGDLQALAIDQVRFARSLPPVAVMAYGPDGETENLTDQVGADGTLAWTAPAGEWTVIALFAGQHGKMVERAAPGGEGLVIDHFSTPAIEHYLERFDEAFAGKDISALRAFFNDSYEVDDARGQANWTPEFLSAFRDKRGYDLREQLPVLFSEEDDHHPRVLTDVRETFSDLLLETFTHSWDEWADSHGAAIRNQAHGSPAAILDLYAASDIPETEGTQPLRIKFATSAAHVTGKPLVSAEAGTWLGEHFESNWADLKENLDRYFVNGVNHVVYHGNAYSPAEAIYPGRLFYAAFHANSRNPMWRDLKALNDYVSRTQSVLQSGEADNDILLYFPIHDRYATPGPEMLQHFDGHGPTLDNSEVGQLGEDLLEAGHAFDFISDRQLESVTYADALVTGDATYRTIVVPRTTYMPLGSFRKMVSLAEAGATVIFHGRLPESVPGLHDYESRQEELRAIAAQLSWNRTANGMEAPVGAGRLIAGPDVLAALHAGGVQPEQLVEKGLEYQRRDYAGGTLYFLVNATTSATDGWVSLRAKGKAAAILDPMTGQRASARIQTDEEASINVWLHLAAGAATFVWVSPEAIAGDKWAYFQPSGRTQELSGEWNLDFLTGGPDLPAATELDRPQSWTELGDDKHRTFAGTGRYTVRFPRPQGGGDTYLLDLGKVYETASVRLNGDSLATLVGPTYELEIPARQLRNENVLTIDVSNRMINRIIDLDRRNVFWKRFYNTNFPARRGENRGAMGLFDAGAWEPVPSGLVGPVTLTPGRSFDNY